MELIIIKLLGAYNNYVKFEFKFNLNFIIFSMTKSNEIEKYNKFVTLNFSIFYA